MSPKKRKPFLKTLLSAHLACSCGASRPNRLNVYEPQSRPKPKSTSSSSNEGERLTTFPSSKGGQSNIDKLIISPSLKISSVPPSDVLLLERCVAVVKDSNDPYEDFRHSMLQMIFENEIFSTEDLHHLLRCFLRLNSPATHHFILRAFFQVCDAVVSSSTTPSDHLKLDIWYQH